MLLRRRIATAVTAALAAIAFVVIPKSTAYADGEFGPDTCRQGFVWRDAVPGDRVCVTPATRDQTRSDNAQAEARRAPGGGAFGPDTCRQGFVWRDAVPGDRVCVTPATRDQTRSDNAQAEARRAPDIPPPCADAGGLSGDQTVPEMVVRCAGYWRVTLTAFVHQYPFLLVTFSDAGAAVQIEHWEDDHWVSRPARSITIQNVYQPRRAGDVGNTDCPSLGICAVPPAPRGCQAENSSSLDCRDYGSPLNARAVRSSATVALTNGQFVGLPEVMDSF